MLFRNSNTLMSLQADSTFFNKLPGEVRNEVYSFILKGSFISIAIPSSAIIPLCRRNDAFKNALNMLSLCIRMHKELSPLLERELYMIMGIFNNSPSKYLIPTNLITFPFRVELYSRYKTLYESTLNIHFTSLRRLDLGFCGIGEWQHFAAGEALDLEAEAASLMSDPGILFSNECFVNATKKESFFTHPHATSPWRSSSPSASDLQPKTQHNASSSAPSSSAHAFSPPPSPTPPTLPRPSSPYPHLKFDRTIEIKNLLSSDKSSAPDEARESHFTEVAHMRQLAWEGEAVPARELIVQ